MHETRSATGPQRPGTAPIPEPAPDQAPEAEAETEAEDEAWDNEGGHAPSAPRQGGTPPAQEHSGRH
jgi:hypothetical protein